MGRVCADGGTDTVPPRVYLFDAFFVSPDPAAAKSVIFSIYLLFLMPNWLLGFAVSSAIVVHSRRKRSLSPDGAAGAFVLGLATCTSTFAYFTVILLVFFLASSKLTKVILTPALCDSGNSYNIH